MSLIMRHSRARLHAAPSARRQHRAQRLANDNRQLQHQLDGAGWLIESLRARLDAAETLRREEVGQLARVLGGQVRELLDERQAHEATRRQLETAIRANTANASATTVQTDVTALRAAIADRYEDAPDPGPQYTPPARTVSPVIRVVALWDSPQAAHPAAVPLPLEVAA